MKSDRPKKACFLGLGVLLGALVQALSWYWLDILGHISHQPHMLAYSLQTPIQMFIRARLWYIPWIVLLAILAACLRKKHFSGALFYSIGVVASTCVFYGVIEAQLFIMPPLYEYFRPMPFDSALWKNSEVGYSRTPVRIRMMNDLVETHSLEGMSRREIEELLGQSGSGAQPREHD